MLPISPTKWSSFINETIARPNRTIDRFQIDANKLGHGHSPRAVIRKLYTADAATSHGVFPLRFLKFGSAPRSTSIFTNFSCPTMAASKIANNIRCDFYSLAECKLSSLVSLCRLPCNGVSSPSPRAFTSAPAFTKIIATL